MNLIGPLRTVLDIFELNKSHDHRGQIVFPCRYHKYLEKRTQSASTNTRKSLTQFFQIYWKNYFYVNTRTPPAVTEKRPVISLVTWFGGSLSFQLRPLKSSLGKARKVAVTLRRKETSLSWISSQMIMMLCEFAWTFCLLVFSITGSTGTDLFLSVLLFLSFFLIDSL